jgi:hypothetical protein
VAVGGANDLKVKALAESCGAATYGDLDICAGVPWIFS